MRRRRRNERPPEECPECYTKLDPTAAALYLCADDEEALRIVAFLRRSIFAKIGDARPRRIYLDGSYEPRPDIERGAHESDFWFTGNGLRLEAVRIAWIASPTIEREVTP